ncbi:AMP-binding protein [Pinisolibacter aquiterrae]|uniref:AMP-binding protein n=1 Tax=Pinisolibacter aquiterrae TaxID=2815579 RepID=UPI001C3C742E|nr:AMP-binding protein [Pinisolibacter aquiterrae]MBV5262968.1 AMP-binding protein [Pinisolibacter aquiterrae]MCC8235310.1 AMP-binding protein [Pinisolibacter aquiterrae]
MLPTSATYEDVMATFRWIVPTAYNIGIDACHKWAAVEPDRPAILQAHPDGTFETWSFGRLSRAAHRLSNVLVAEGIARGDRVAILLPQSPETAFAHVAVYSAGAIALPLADVFGVEALTHRLADSGARALITNRVGARKVAEIRPLLPELERVFCFDGAEDGAIDLAGAMARASDAFAPVATLADDPALMIYTSGTTGAPKGALHGHRVVLGHVPGVQYAHEFLPQPGDLAWTPADWAWAGGLLNILLPCLTLGVPVMAARFEHFDPDFTWDLIARHGVRNAFVPPTAMKLLRGAGSPRGRHAIDLRTIGSAGEALGRETYEWAKAELGMTINEFYGQTECNLVLGSCAKIGVTRSGAIGKPTPGHRVAVIGADGRPVAPGDTGQIAVMRPDPVMFLGYWKQPEATAAKFLGDWMTTGDQGIVDEEGYVFFVGRDDDLITSSGYRIGPAEIEDCLAGHPAVALAAVVGKPDPLRTEIVKAHVKLAPGFSPSEALVAEIRAHVRNRLSAHEYPREIEFVDEIPLTTTGKVIRRFFREKARDEAARDASGVRRGGRAPVTR